MNDKQPSRPFSSSSKFFIACCCVCPRSSIPKRFSDDSTINLLAEGLAGMRAKATNNGTEDMKIDYNCQRRGHALQKLVELHWCHKAFEELWRLICTRTFRLSLILFRTKFLWALTRLLPLPTQSLVLILLRRSFGRSFREHKSQTSESLLT